MERRAEILQAAQGLFAQFGLKKVTTDDIAKQSRISKATIYKVYSNKSEIFEEVVAMEFDHLLSKIREAVDKEDTVRGKFRAHLLTKLTILHELINFYRVTQETWGEYWPHIVGIRRKYMAEEKEIVKGIIKLGNKTGELDVKKVDLTAQIMVVALKSMEFPWAMDTTSVSLSTYVERMLEMMLEGLSKR